MALSLWTRAFFTILALLAIALPATTQPIDLLPAGESGKPPAEWFMPVKGWDAAWTDHGDLMVVRLRPSGAEPGPFGNIMRTLDATPYRARKVTLQAKVFVESPSGHAQMWLRVDRAGGQAGGFDNMGDRPIRPGMWTPASIELDVAPDAERLALGMLSIGGASVLFTDVTLTTGAEVRQQAPSPPTPLPEQGLDNVVAAARLLALVRFFHPSDEAVGVGSWDHVAVTLVEQAEPAATPAALAAALQDAIAPIAPSVRVWAGTIADAPEIPVPAGATEFRSWRHNGAGSIADRAGPNAYASTVVKAAIADTDESALATRVIIVDLGAGVWCAVPRLVPADERGTLPRVEGASPWADGDALDRLTVANRATRLAAVAELWGVMEHFYPYFDVPPCLGAATDWDAALRKALADAAAAPDESAMLFTLQRMVAHLHDGHGAVNGPGASFGASLPLAVTWAGDDIVVSGKGSSAPASITAGDAIVSINGRPIADWVGDASERISSATEGWTRSIIASQILRDPFRSGDAPAACVIEFRRPDGTLFTAELSPAPFETIVEPAFARPLDGAELAPGIRYFDLNAAEPAALAKAMPDLAKAEGIVFDMRGYPGGAAYQLMQHLIDKPASSAQWNIPVVTLPSREGWTWNTGGRWQLKPAKPRLSARIAFVTDGRAISYAESIMGIVEAYALGHIVGDTTAGTNGNVNPFKIAGGYTISWTGMKVLKHDGSTHHGVGIAPTERVTPTAAGIAAGRDEVLERAVEVLKADIARGGP